MFCTNCGNEIEAYARFCSKCGREAGATAGPEPVAPSVARQTKPAGPRMETHVTVVGWLLVGSGALSVLGGLAVMFTGQFIRLIPMHDPDVPPFIFPFVTGITSLFGMGILALATVTIAAGVGLLQYRPWARTLAIIAAVFSVFHFPIGTAIAAYAFWVLLSDEGRQYYKSRSESTMMTSGA